MANTKEKNKSTETFPEKDLLGDILKPLFFYPKINFNYVNMDS